MKNPPPQTRTDCLIRFQTNYPPLNFLPANSSSDSTSKSFAQPTQRPTRSNIIKPFVKAAGTETSVQPSAPMAWSTSMHRIGKSNINKLSEVSGIEVKDYKSFIQALEQRRAFFKSMGATATDHAALTPSTAELSEVEAEEIFQRALNGESQTQRRDTIHRPHADGNGAHEH